MSLTRLLAFAAAAPLSQFDYAALGDETLGVDVDNHEMKTTLLHIAAR